LQKTLLLDTTTELLFTIVLHRLILWLQLRILIITKPNSKRTRSDKFPLILHLTGQFCKKIKGRLYYFGCDKRKALERYLEHAAYLHTSRETLPIC